MRRHPVSVALVLAQFLLIGAVALLTPWARVDAVRMALFLSALTLVAWAALLMGPSTFTVFPEPRPGARFIVRGPYRWVRHPMYLGVVLAAGALGSLPPMGLRGLFAALLLVVVVLKVHREERLLDATYPERPARMRGVHKLMPGLW